MSTNFETKPDAWGIEHLGLQYLAERGCTPEEATALGIQFITHAQANVLAHTAKDSYSFFKTRDAIWIPTHGPDGSLHPYHGQAIFFSPNRKPWKSHTPKAEAYPNEVNYIGTSNLKPGDTLYWAESTLKAAILYFKFGLPAIGLNGVWGWSCGNNTLALSTTQLPPGLNHVLITDSLNSTKKSSMVSVLSARKFWRNAVRKALNPATVRHIELPHPPNSWPKGDWGLDDIYMTKGVEFVKALLSNTQESRDTTELEIWLEHFNQKFVYVKSVSKVYDIASNLLLTKQNFFDNYASTNINDADGGTTAIAPIWFKSANRKEVVTLAFRPGEAEIVDERLNLWKGFAVEPVANRVLVQKYWVDTAYDAFGQDAKHFIEILACLVQHPERRISRHILINGKQGSGKNFLIEPIARVFANHKQDWSVKNFINNFNSAHRNCRFGLINEAGDPKTAPKGQAEAMGEMLKKNADPNEKTMQLEPKGVDISVVDRLQFNVTISNYGPPFDLQPGDRRCYALLARQHMCIVSPLTKGTKSLEYWGERWDWINYEHGTEAVLEYLLSLDISGVDFDGPVPLTDYKRSLLAQETDRVKPFLHRFGADPLGILVEVLGEGSLAELPRPICFDALCVAMCFHVLTKGVENMSSITTSIGRDAFEAWECSSEQATARIMESGVKKPKSVRAYAIEENLVVKLNRESRGMSGEDVYLRVKALQKLLAEAAGIQV